jgi:cytoskeletal protein RodZ
MGKDWDENSFGYQKSEKEKRREDEREEKKALKALTFWERLPKIIFWLMIIILVLPFYFAAKLEQKKLADPTSPSLEEIWEKFLSNDEE